MMDFSKMEMTHEQMSDNQYRLRVGNDIIEVETYFDSHGYFRVATLDHYIMTPSNKPTNPNRTCALMVYVDEYLEKLYQKEVEEDLREIATFPKGCLKENYKGRRLHCYEGMTAYDVIRKFDDAHSACVIKSSNVLPIFKELAQMPEGFLSEELESVLMF